VKVLTAYCTTLNHVGRLNELRTLEAVAPVDRNDNLPFLIDRFYELGPHGQHLCFVVPPLSTDLSNFRRSSPNNRLPLHTVKMVLLCVLQALERLHRIDIIHTGRALCLLSFGATHWSSLYQTSSLIIFCLTLVKTLFPCKMTLRPTRP
jgi:hypothetical protein